MKPGSIAAGISFLLLALLCFPVSTWLGAICAGLALLVFAEGFEP